MTRQILLTQGKVAMVDDADYEWLLRWKWCAGGPYAMRGDWATKRCILMHRVIAERMGIKAPQIDHVNRNGVDNRRANLRGATTRQQAQNRGIQANNRHSYKGVEYRKTAQTWRAHITLNGRRIYLGTFKDELHAAIAYNDAAGRLFGKFARLNVLTEPRRTESGQEASG